MPLIILGSNGDLAFKKIFPALNQLNLQENIILYCREESREQLEAKIIENSSIFSNIKSKMKIITGSYTDLSPLKMFENSKFYLSIPPFLYLNVLKEIIKFKGGTVAIEKPYGENCQDFQKMYDLIKEKKELKCLFIDHFITKKIPIESQNLVNTKKFKYVLNKDFIESCTIAIKENITANKRKYFDLTGTLKDMLVNHLIQYLIVFSGSRDDIKVNLGKTKLNEKYCLFGQYKDYKKEMDNESETETFALVVAEIENERWKQTPFILYSGKSMDEKSYKIIFDIKDNRREEFLKNFNIKRDIKEEKMTLTFDILGEEIYINVDKEKIVLYNQENIPKNYEFYDYEGIIHALCNSNKKFPFVLVEEIGEFWRIFSKMNPKEHKKIIYEEGYDFKKEIEDLKTDLKKNQ